MSACPASQQALQVPMRVATAWISRWKCADCRRATQTVEIFSQQAQIPHSNSFLKITPLTARVGRQKSDSNVCRIQPIIPIQRVFICTIISRAIAGEPRSYAHQLTGD